MLCEASDQLKTAEHGITGNSYLKLIAEKHAKATNIKHERVIIKFALASVPRLILPAKPRIGTGKTTLFSCSSEWEYDGDVKVVDPIDQLTVTSKCSPHIVVHEIIVSPKMID